jgi:ribosomal protein S18 acetylase RimI-like enzyme
MQIIPAKISEHFSEAVRLHQDGITEGFLSTLGTSFLTVLYRGISSTPGCGVRIAVEDGRVLGFVAFSRDVGSCYKNVLKSNWFSLSLAMLPNALRPAVYRKVLETLLYPVLHRKTNSKPSQKEAHDSRAELLSMAVSDDARGKGIGKLLVRAVDQEMSDMGVPGYFVVTHGVDERSNGFYVRCGFRKVREFQNHGKPMNEYYKELSRFIQD